MKSRALAKRSASKPVTSASSLILWVSWALIAGWMLLLIGFWKGGYLTADRIDYVTKVIDETETQIIDGISHIHLQVPVEQLPGGPALHNQPQKPLLKQQQLQVQQLEVQKKEASDIHVIFSTDCNPFQDWQTLVVFNSAREVGQKGPVTRIASGCTEEKQQTLTALYKKLYPEYYVHFTPDFKSDEKIKHKYDFYNKPRGLKHWLEFANPPVPDGMVIALIDPDMIFVRPLTTQIKGSEDALFRGKPLKEMNKKFESEIMDKIARGKPVAQTYGLGAPWTNDNHMKFNRKKTCGEGSPCLTVETNFGENHFAVGPPYIVEKQDFVRIAKTWVEFTPRVYEKYPYLLAEMYAYSMAAAHENLPHLQLENYMVSNEDSGGEGWPWVDALEDACIPPVNGIYYPGIPMPSLIHYCQSYRAGDIGFAKRAAPLDMFTCQSPLLVEFPSDINNATIRYKKKGSETRKETMTRIKAKHNIFPLCIIHRSINKALINYKKVMCEAEGIEANYEMELNVLSPWKPPKKQKKDTSKHS